MTRPPSWVLFAAAGLVLAVALAQIVHRRATDPAAVAARQQQRDAQEIAERKAELERDRAAITGRIRELQKAGDAAAALQLAARYSMAHDPELDALYRESALAESRRQLLADTRRLLAAQCTESRAWHDALEELGDLGLPASAMSPDDLRLTRVGAAEVMPMILAQLRGDPGSVIVKHEDPNAPGHHEHHIQVHPDYAINFRTGTPDESLVCAWRVTGVAPSSAKGLELVFWLAPEPTGKDVRAEALRYVPPAIRPAPATQRPGRPR